jgi:hypothetical protein
MSCDQWLKRTFGKVGKLKYWMRRDAAVRKLGEASRRTVHHLVAIWLAGHCPAEKVAEAMAFLMRARKANGDNCLTLEEALPGLKKILGHVHRAKSCAKCAAKDQQIAELERLLVEERSRRENRVVAVNAPMMTKQPAREPPALHG